MIDSYIYHHGIKGQKWGERRYQYEDGTLTEAGKQRYYKVGFSTRRRAKKDAKEYARAQMFYGEGAGNRRKIIKNIVNERSKDPGYKQEFEKYLAEQDMSSHAEKARRERHIKDASKTTGKTVRGVVNMALGTIGPVSAGAAAIYTLAHVTGVDAIVADAARKKISDLKHLF